MRCCQDVEANNQDATIWKQPGNAVAAGDWECFNAATPT